MSDNCSCKCSIILQADKSAAKARSYKKQVEDLVSYQLIGEILYSHAPLYYLSWAV